MAIVTSTEAYVVANFKETQVAGMKPGQCVDIHIDAYPNMKVKGKVESLAPATGATFSLVPQDTATGNFTKIVQRVPVRIALDAVEGDADRLPARPDGAPAGRPWLPVGLSVDVRVRVH